MRSHITAFAIGGGLSLLAAGAFALIAPQIADDDDDGDKMHIVNIGDGDSGSFQFKDDDNNIAADWKGDFTFAPDGRSLKALARKLVVTVKKNGVERKAVFEAKDGRITAQFFRDDDKVEAAEGDKEAADLLQLFARSSGVNADGRVKAMLAEGGVPRVIAEVDQLVGAHAVGAYIETLAEETTLSDADIRGLTERVKGLDSDYSKRSALAALISTQTLSEAAVADVIAAAKTIEGDHELRLIVEELADEKMDARNFSVATSLIEEIEGDHEIRLAVSALLESDSVTDADAVRALDAAASSIEGDHELRLVLEAADERVQKDDVGAAALRGIGAIEGSHERRLAIESLASALDGPSPHWLALIEAAKGIDSDHDRRLTLEALQSEAPEEAELRAALRAAAETISSDHERRLALEAME